MGVRTILELANRADAYHPRCTAGYFFDNGRQETGRCPNAGTRANSDRAAAVRGCCCRALAGLEPAIGGHLHSNRRGGTARRTAEISLALA